MQVHHFHHAELVSGGLSRLLQLGQVALRPAQWVVRSEGLARNFTSASNVNLTDDADDRVIVVHVRLRRGERVTSAAGAQCDATRNPRMCLLGESKNIVEILQQFVSRGHRFRC